MMKRLLVLLSLCIGMGSSAAFAQDETEDLTDYKTACLAAIDNISLIGNSFSMRSMISIAKTSLNACSTKDAMRRTMTTLRAGVLGYIRTTATFPDGQVFTGLVGNHSFDTGDTSLWYCLSFDLSQLSLTDISNAISGGDVSSLGKAIYMNVWNEDTKPIENTGNKAMQSGDGKFYLNSTQLVMQPILSLKAGIYSFSAKVACNPGFFSMSKVHLNALVIPSDVVQEVIGDIIGDNPNWEEIFNNFDMSPYMGSFLQDGKLYTESVTCQSLSTFTNGEVRFIVDEGDIVVIGMDAGMVPFIGTDQFRADNLQLTSLRSADKILTPAKADLAAALQGLSEVQANYNADLEETATQPAFTYDRTLTENYNQAFRTAQDKYVGDGLADLLTEEDLKNIDGIDAKLQNHYSAEIQALRQAKDTFDKQAFIAPTADEQFNIVMHEDWISLLTTKWTGNAVTLGEDMSMQFSQQPGQSALTLAFAFEPTSDTSANQFRACVRDHRDKYYLAATGNSLVLTEDPAEALFITAIPSYTEEGETQLMAGDFYLGTSNASNAFVQTDGGSLLRPTRTGLAVLPASEMQITLTIPAGSNASTLMLPFDADLTEGLTVGIVTGTEETVIMLSPSSTIHANQPCLVFDPEGDYTFSGVPQALHPAYGEGLLTGCYTPYTTQDGNEYKLTQEDGLTFFLRQDGQPIAACECYLKSDTPSDILCLSPEDATGLKSMDDGKWIMDNEAGAWYGLSGRIIVNGQSSNRKLPKGIYIHNGRKTVIR